MTDGTLQDDELYLPRTVVNKLIKEIVPNIRVSTDARDLLLNCCTEFIHLLASEASDISERQQKKVISPEHVVEALVTLGFQEYVPDVKAVHKEYKEQASKHRKRTGKSRLDRLGIPEEELARQQQQLFDEARQQQMESELLENQKIQQSMNPNNQLPLATSNNDASTTSSANLPALQQSNVSPVQTVTDSMVTNVGPSTSVSGELSTSKQSSDQVPQKLKPAQLNVKPAVTLPSLPQSAAMTVASLQATSSLLQQALAMASAQMAATSNTQLQQTTKTQADILQQNILLQQPALQAALAAQRMASQVQSKQQLPQQTLQAQIHEPVKSTPATGLVSPPDISQPKVSNVAVTSQELSVAQMMMTLAQASNRNTLVHNSGIATDSQAVSFEHPSDSTNKKSE